MIQTDAIHRMTVTRYIVGYKKEESDYLLKFLFDHIALSQDLQTRIKWAPGTVVVWDVSFPFFFFFLDNQFSLFNNID